MSYIKTILSALKARFAKKEDVDNISEGIDNLYEKLGTKMNQHNPSGTGSFSLNRNNNSPIGNYSHAEGFVTTASGEDSHAEGYSTTASGSVSHAEGFVTTASGVDSHAEGNSTTASGSVSHAEGFVTTASGNYSHAEGYSTIASGNFQHVHGKYNVSDVQGKYADIVGWGTSSTTSKRKNISALETNGTLHLAGDVYTNANKDSTGGNKLATETYVDDSIEDKQSQDITDTEGYFTTDTVEGALSEIGGKLDGLETALDAINDGLEELL